MAYDVRVTTTSERPAVERLGDAHRAVLDWCAARGLSVAGPRREVYGDCRADPAELQTEVYWLLA